MSYRPNMCDITFWRCSVPFWRVHILPEFLNYLLLLSHSKINVNIQMYLAGSYNLESNHSLAQLDVVMAQQDPFEDEPNLDNKGDIVFPQQRLIDNAGSEYYEAGGDAEEGGTGPRKYSFSPRIPANSPVILSWKNLSVTTRTAKPKILLDNISGSITGGFWAIMGASGGGTDYYPLSN